MDYAEIQMMIDIYRYIIVGSIITNITLILLVVYIVNQLTKHHITEDEIIESPNPMENYTYKSEETTTTVEDK